MAQQNIEKFRPTNGRVTGVVGLAVVAAFMVLAVVEGYPLWSIGLLAAIGVLTWAAVLRPGVRIAGDELELRNMFLTQAIPLAAIEEVVVLRVLAVRAGERRFVSPAINRSLRQTMRHRKRDRPGGAFANDGLALAALAASSYPDYVEERINTAARDHRDRLGIKVSSDEQQALAADIRTDIAWPEIAAFAVSFLILLVGVVLAL